MDNWRLPKTRLSSKRTIRSPSLKKQLLIPLSVAVVSFRVRDLGENAIQSLQHAALGAHCYVSVGVRLGDSTDVDLAVHYALEATFVSGRRARQDAFADGRAAR